MGGTRDACPLDQLLISLNTHSMYKGGGDPVWEYLYPAISLFEILIHF